MLHIILSSIFTLLIITNQLFANDLCYKADKNNLIHIDNNPHDVIFDLSSLKKDNWIYLSFASFLPIPYAESTYGFYCVENNNTPKSYTCSGDCDAGSMTIRIEDSSLSVNVDYATMANTPDDPIIRGIASKENKFTTAKRTQCPNPRVFKDKTKKHLPYVCYNWKNHEIIDGKETYEYSGCLRHNKACASIKAKHFGQYPNDYESHLAYKRCEASQPRPVPKTNTSSPTKPFIKTKRKKDALLKSITIKDISIYDLDYYENLVIAGGEDDSAQTRKLQSMDEHHESVMIRSVDGGKSWAKIRENDASTMPYNSIIVLDSKRIVVSSAMEGSGGAIILSSDAGETWKTTYDDAFVESMQHIKGDTIIAKTFGPTLKSIDGGKSWIDISSKK